MQTTIRKPETKNIKDLTLSQKKALLKSKLEKVSVDVNMDLSIFNEWELIFLYLDVLEGRISELEGLKNDK